MRSSACAPQSVGAYRPYWLRRRPRASVLLAAQAAGIPLLHKPVSPLKLRALLAQLLSHPDSEIRIAA